MQETQEMGVQSLGWEDPLEKEMAAYSSILAGKIPWTEEPGGLQSIRLQRVRHDWATEHCMHRAVQSVGEAAENTNGACTSEAHRGNVIYPSSWRNFRSHSIHCWEDWRAQIFLTYDGLPPDEPIISWKSRTHQTQLSLAYLKWVLRALCLSHLCWPTVGPNHLMSDVLWWSVARNINLYDNLL